MHDFSHAGLISFNVLVLLEGISHIAVGLPNSEATDRRMSLAKALFRLAYIFFFEKIQASLEGIQKRSTSTRSQSNAGNSL